MLAQYLVLKRIGCKASYMLDFQVLVLKEVMNSLFEYVFFDKLLCRISFICVSIPDHTILFIKRSATVCVLLKT